MSEKSTSRKPRGPKRAARPARASQEKGSIEAEVRAALDQAWQTVKPILKREQDGAHVTSELLNFKLRRGA